MKIGTGRRTRPHVPSVAYAVALIAWNASDKTSPRPVDPTAPKRAKKTASQQPHAEPRHLAPAGRYGE
jgi:hypothetical protein